VTPPPAATLVLPSSDDPVVAGATQAIGGPPGKRARIGERRLFTPVRVVVALTLLTSLLGLWQKAGCRTQPWVEEYQYTRMCYTDVFALYYAERLNEETVNGVVTREGAVPYYDHPVEYPPVIGLVMGTVAKVVNELPESERPKRFYDLTWVLLTGAAVVVAVTTARLAGRRRVWDAALFALAPGLLLHATTNWDLLATAIAGLALVQWQRRRPLAAGVLLGLATATKLYPVLLLVPLLLLCFRAGKLREGLTAAVATAVTAVSIVLPVYLTAPYFADSGGQVRVADSPLSRLGDEGLGALSPRVETTLTAADGTPIEGYNSVYRFFHLNNTRGADWDSLHFALRTCDNETKGAQDSGATGVGAVVEPLRKLVAETADLTCRGLTRLVFDESTKAGQPDHSLNRTVAVTFLLSLVVIALLVLRAPRRPRVMQVAFLVLAAFLLTNKVFSPQYVIWLLPVAVLARPRWRPFLWWQATEVMVLFTRFYFFVRNDNAGEGIAVEWFVTAVLVRDVTLLVLCAFVVRDFYRPERDVVRRDGVDDPAGGVLDGAPDRGEGAQQRELVRA
jgi:uncharacterized membrane protein